MRFALTHALLCLIYFLPLRFAAGTMPGRGAAEATAHAKLLGMTDQRVTEVGQATFEQPIQLPALASPRLRSRADEAAD